MRSKSSEVLLTAEIAENAEMEEIINSITSSIIGAAINVHRELGPGLLESTYEACLVHELAQEGIEVERQKALPVVYRGVRLDCGYRIDLLVQGQVVVEVKAVGRLEPIHRAQVLSYLCLLYTSPSPRDRTRSRMPSSA